MPSPLASAMAGKAPDQQLGWGGLARLGRAVRLAKLMKSIGATLAPDGKHYVSDPKRPGKYLRVVPRG